MPSQDSDCAKCGLHKDNAAHKGGPIDHLWPPKHQYEPTIIRTEHPEKYAQAMMAGQPPTSKATGSAETGGEKAARVEDSRFDLAERELNAAWNEDGNSPAMCNVIEAALIVIAELRSRLTRR